MENVNPTILAGVACVVIVAILFNRRLRIVFFVSLIVFIAVAASRVILRNGSCPSTSSECVVELQPSWAGPCIPSERGAILKVDDRYYLAADAGTEATARCLDWRIWK